MGGISPEQNLVVHSRFFDLSQPIYFFTRKKKNINFSALITVKIAFQLCIANKRKRTIKSRVSDIT